MPKTPQGTYLHHLSGLLRRYAPEHDYIIDNNPNGDIDIYHSFMSSLPFLVHLRGIRSVVTVSDLNFLHHPQAYTFFDRLVRIRLYKYSCRRACCLITLNRRVKEELVERLNIDERRVKVVTSLAAHPPMGECATIDCDAVRKKYSLPDGYVLTAGVAEPRYHQLELIESMIELNTDLGLVICGRNTRYSDFLLEYARAVGDAPNVEFIYEPAFADVGCLFRMAKAFVYIPDADADASVSPVVEALRAGVPIVLSDTPAHREVAADAAVYVPRGVHECLIAALDRVLHDEVFRRDLIAKGRERAALFSEQAVVQRLIDIYTSM